MGNREKWLALPLIHSFDLQPDLAATQNGQPSLEEVGPLLGTCWEREWLQQQLERDEAECFLGTDLLQKLSFLGEFHRTPPTEALPIRWLSVLRQAQRTSQGMRLVWRDNRQLEKAGAGWPMALEYYCSRGEWYLHWWPAEQQFAYCIIPLRQIQSAEPNDTAMPESVRLQFDELSKARHSEMLICLPASYSGEYWRLLCAFSCFDKQVEEDEAGNLLLRIWYVEDDYRYLLMRLRSLGRRVEVLAPGQCRADLLADAKNALARYGHPKA